MGNFASDHFVLHICTSSRKSFLVLIFYFVSGSKRFIHNDFVISRYCRLEDFVRFSILRSRGFGKEEFSCDTVSSYPEFIQAIFFLAMLNLN